MKRVCIVATGVANLASVKSSLARIGVPYEHSCEANVIRDASHVIVPGVGSLASGVDALSKDVLSEVLLARLQGNRPTLGICLGMQLMGMGSDESLGVSALGFMSCHARRFAPSMISPHMGWNQVLANESHRVLFDGYAYFAHSYYWELGQSGLAWAKSCYGESSFISGFERGNIIGCQFHPELSGGYGRQVLQNFVDLEVSC